MVVSVNTESVNVKKKKCNDMLGFWERWQRRIKKIIALPVLYAAP